MYERADADDLRVVDRWDGGVGWLAHPDEEGERASHCVTGARAGSDGENAVWLLDPLDAPGLDDLLDDHGAVAGVVVCSNYHARDAGALARRHGVAVHVPAWDAMDRVVERVDAPVERFTGGVAGFDARRVDPLPGWTEAVLYRERDGTLYVPDVMSGSGKFATGGERIGLFLLSRLRPPRHAVGDATPERILFGHGRGVFADPATALDDCIAGARRRFPRALATTAVTQVRALVDALRQ